MGHNGCQVTMKSVPYYRRARCLVWLPISSVQSRHLARALCDLIFIKEIAPNRFNVGARATSLSAKIAIICEILCLPWKPKPRLLCELKTLYYIACYRGFYLCLFYAAKSQAASAQIYYIEIGEWNWK